MTETNSTPDPDLRTRLEGATEGLLYTSESDEPFEFFFLAGGAAGWPYGAEEFARRAGVGDAEPAEERTLDRFFAPHIEGTDPADTRSQEIRPRFESLKALLGTSLREVRVFRTGEVRIQCYVVGDDGHGNLAGLRTLAIET
jgi:hypothetical protein